MNFVWGLVRPRNMGDRRTPWMPAVRASSGSMRDAGWRPRRWGKPRKSWPNQTEFWISANKCIVQNHQKCKKCKKLQENQKTNNFLLYYLHEFHNSYFISFCIWGLFLIFFSKINIYLLRKYEFCLGPGASEEYGGPPHALDAGRSSEQRFNARRWLTPATLGDQESLGQTRQSFESSWSNQKDLVKPVQTNQ